MCPITPFLLTLLPSLIQEVYQDPGGCRKGADRGRTPATGGSGEEIGLSRPHHLPGRWQEAENAEAPPQDAYNMTPEQYRERWGLTPDYPMVAPNYARHRVFAGEKDRARHKAASRPEVAGGAVSSCGVCARPPRPGSQCRWPDSRSGTARRKRRGGLGGVNAGAGKRRGRQRTIGATIRDAESGDRKGATLTGPRDGGP